MEHAIRHNPAVRLAVVYCMVAMLTLATLPSLHSAGCGMRSRLLQGFTVPHDHEPCAACAFQTLVKLAPGICPDMVLRPTCDERAAAPEDIEAPIVGAHVVPRANSPPWIAED